MHHAEVVDRTLGTHRRSMPRRTSTALSKATLQPSESISSAAKAGCGEVVYIQVECKRRGELANVTGERESMRYGQRGRPLTKCRCV